MSQYSRQAAVPRVPRWFKTVVAAIGILVPARRTWEEFYPSFDPNQVMSDRYRVNIIHDIMIRLGLPAYMGKNVTIVVGKTISLRGGLWSKRGAVLELTPQLAESLGRRNIEIADAVSDYAVAMRTKIYTDSATGTQVPVLSEWPFEAEREAVIAHELIHLRENHSSGIIKLNALMVAAAATFYVKPALSLIPLAAYGLGLHFYTRGCELEADRMACLTLGPHITRAMLARQNAKKRLDQIVLGKYTWDQPAFRHVVMDMLFSYLFHVPLDTRISYLRSILKQQVEEAEQKKLLQAPSQTKSSIKV